MNSPTQLVTPISFQIAILGETDAHHPFERLCLGLTRCRIVSNVLPRWASVRDTDGTHTLRHDGEILPRAGSSIPDPGRPSGVPRSRRRLGRSRLHLDDPGDVPVVEIRRLD